MHNSCKIGCNRVGYGQLSDCKMRHDSRIWSHTGIYNSLSLVEVCVQSKIERNRRVSPDIGPCNRVSLFEVFMYNSCKAGNNRRIWSAIGLYSRLSPFEECVHINCKVGGTQHKDVIRYRIIY